MGIIKNILNKFNKKGINYTGINTNIVSADNYGDALIKGLEGVGTAPLISQTSATQYIRNMVYAYYIPIINTGISFIF